MQLRPADIAKECGVSVGTVRNWCSEYAEFLSAGANPSDGNRLLNERDLEICRYIVSLRKQGMSKPQIILRLRETTFGHLDTEQPIVKPIEALQSLQEGHHDVLAPIVVSDYLIAIERRFEALEQFRQTPAPSLRDGVVMFAAGFVCALVFVLLLLALFVLRHYL